ncbi:MAG: Nicotinamidase [Candidatus Celerinatantimonas neptuna]|nr:MAG: Nicotinamidase [Candidatus Celerinatantimonas neptuna]
MSEYNHGLNLASNDALLIVDLQNDFLPGGALGIEGADEIIPTINAYIEKFEQKQQCIIFSRDWHPQDHCSFNNQSGPWPVHCVQNTHGAALSNILNWPSQALLVSKANTSSEDAYSAFEKTALATRLKNMHIERLFICGLATDYCVLHTTLDAIKAGFDCYLLTDAIDAVNIQSDDGTKAIEKMNQAGATPITIGEIDTVTQ